MDFFSTEIAYKEDFIFIEKSRCSVAMFSKFRIPFETAIGKKGLIDNLKSALLEAIRGLHPKQDCVLQARYGTTEQKSFYDVENVLFYNIGTSNFNRLANNGVGFCSITQNEILALRKKFNIPTEYKHFYEYKVVGNFTDKNLGTLLAEAKNVTLKCVGLNPPTVWTTFRNEKNKIAVFDRIETSKRDTFAIALDIQKPKVERFNIMTSIKPLLDGLICSLHHSEFSEDELVYFSQLFDCEKSFFVTDSISVLGERQNKFLQGFPNTKKWNPADELCDYVSIKVKDGATWNLNARIYSTVKCPRVVKEKFQNFSTECP